MTNNLYVDYHIHSNLSDGALPPAKIIDYAENKGLHSICITDHFSQKVTALPFHDLEGYYRKLKLLQTQVNNNRDIFFGVGIEVDFSRIFNVNEILKYEWDIILFEYALNGYDWKEKLEFICKLIDKTDFIISLAHSRLDWISEKEFDDFTEMITTYKLPLELNSSYRNFDDPWFNYLPKNVFYTIGSDAHFPETIGRVGPSLHFIKRANIDNEQILIL